MNNIDKDILLDALFLITHQNTLKNRNLIDELFSYYTNEFSLDNDNKDSIEYILINTIKEIIDLKLDKSKNSKELKLIFNKLKTKDIIFKNTSVLDYLHDILNSNSKLNKKLISSIQSKISQVVIWYRCHNALKKMYGKLNNIKIDYDKNSSDVFHEIIDISKELSKVTLDTKDITNLAIERINLSNKSHIINSYNIYKERNINRVIKSGLQGLNNMCGSKKGFTLGKSVLFCALTHNYKSTMLLNIARWIKEYNTFPVINGKKPLIPYITLENEAHENMMLWFKHVLALNQETYKYKDINKDNIIDIMCDYFNDSNIEIEILRFLPEDFGFDELVELIKYYEDCGYYIPACIIDYLRQMRLYNKNNNFRNKSNHLLLKNLFNQVINFLKSKGITLFTAHQLNREASIIAGNGSQYYPVKRFNESHLEGAMDVAREVDMIIFMHIEKNHKNQKFLTLQWGKHRYEEDTPERYKFIAYPFIEGKGIVDDINGKFQGIKDIYSYGDDEDNNSNDNDIGVAVSLF